MTRIPNSGKLAEALKISVLVFFLLAIAFLGGSSRADAIQIVALRPLSAIFLLAAIVFIEKENFAMIRGPFWALLALAALMALQLIPLPPSIWQSLPGRGPVAEMGAIVGMEGIWRPLTLVPTRTINALASLIVPACALLLFAAYGQSRMPMLALLACGGLDAVLGLVQVSLGAGYFYDIANFGSATGLFANRNHSAVFSAISLLVIARALSSSSLGFNGPLWRVGLSALFSIVLFAALISGSRAGLATMIIALAGSVYLFWRKWSSNQKKTAKFHHIRPIWMGIGVLVLVVATVSAFLFFDRIPGLTRFIEADAAEDLRWRLLPVLGEMLVTYGLVGAGFGSFEEVFHIHATLDLLEPAYVNQAHNDWLQLVIEGGLPMAALVAVSLIWALRSMRSWALKDHRGSQTAVFWCAILAVIVLASAADYPLRAPLFQAYAMGLLVLFCHDRATNTNKRTLVNRRR